MAVMISEVYDALREVGVSEEKARRAAEAVAVQEPRFTAIETRLTRVETRLGVLQWMVGGLYAFMVPALWLLLRVAAKMGALG